MECGGYYYCRLQIAELVALFGFTSSVVRIAAEDSKASNALRTYIEMIRYAEKDFEKIASDVTNTAVVQDQLGEN